MTIRVPWWARGVEHRRALPSAARGNVSSAVMDESREPPPGGAAAAIRRDSLLEHPGYLGHFTGSGSFVVLIHADWPAYPAPAGGTGALLDLGQFPAGTTFKPIDDIDECVLFVAVDSAHDGALWSEGAFHIAIWHSDLLELSAQGWLAGVRAVSQREWELARRDELRDHIRATAARSGDVFDSDPLDMLFFEKSPGEFVPVTLPPLSDDDEDDCAGSFLNRPKFDPATPVALTQQGLTQLDDQQAAQALPDALARAAALLDLGFNDSAVREAAVVLETALRQTTGSRRYGQRLVDDFLATLADAGAVNSFLKGTETAMRTAFKFVRNEFAHSLVDVSPGRARALVVRFADLLLAVEQTTAPE